MMLLEITPLVLIFWVAVRLENVVRRLGRVEKELKIPIDQDVALDLESLAARVHHEGLSTQKTGSPIKS